MIHRCNHAHPLTHTQSAALIGFYMDSYITPEGYYTTGSWEPSWCGGPGGGDGGGGYTQSPAVCTPLRSPFGYADGFSDQGILQTLFAR